MFRKEYHASDPELLFPNDIRTTRLDEITNTIRESPIPCIADFLHQKEALCERFDWLLQLRHCLGNY